MCSDQVGFDSSASPTKVSLQNVHCSFWLLPGFLRIWLESTISMQHLSPSLLSEAMSASHLLESSIGLPFPWGRQASVWGLSQLCKQGYLIALCPAAFENVAHAQFAQSVLCTRPKAQLIRSFGHFLSQLPGDISCSAALSGWMACGPSVQILYERKEKSISNTHSLLHLSESKSARSSLLSSNTVFYYECI